MLSNETFDNKLIRVTLKNLSNDNHFIRGKWGLFYEFNVKKLQNINKNIINTRYQTLTYYGVDKNKLNNFVIKNCLNGIDRVVPIGQALDMTFIWDGYDINRLLSREIEIR